jgi:hypothetical protein
MSYKGPESKKNDSSFDKDRTPKANLKAKKLNKDGV